MRARYNAIRARMAGAVKRSGSASVTVPAAEGCGRKPAADCGLLRCSDDFCRKGVDRPDRPGAQGGRCPTRQREVQKIYNLHKADNRYHLRCFEQYNARSKALPPNEAL